MYTEPEEKAYIARTLEQGSVSATDMIVFLDLYRFIKTRCSLNNYGEETCDLRFSNEGLILHPVIQGIEYEINMKRSQKQIRKDLN
jgi:hypothetical protein